MWILLNISFTFLSFYHVHLHIDSNMFVISHFNYTQSLRITCLELRNLQQFFTRTGTISSIISSLREAEQTVNNETDTYNYGG
jgi:hypothetical protein